MQTVEFSFKTPAQHCLMNAIGSHGRSDKEHAEDVRERSVCMEISPRAKPSDLGGANHPLVFLFKNKEITVGN